MTCRVKVVCRWPARIPITVLVEEGETEITPFIPMNEAEQRRWGEEGEQNSLTSLPYFVLGLKFAPLTIIDITNGLYVPNSWGFAHMHTNFLQKS